MWINRGVIYCTPTHSKSCSENRLGCSAPRVIAEKFLMAITLSGYVNRRLMCKSVDWVIRRSVEAPDCGWWKWFTPYNNNRVASYNIFPCISSVIVVFVDTGAYYLSSFLSHRYLEQVQASSLFDRQGRDTIPIIEGDSNKEPLAHCYHDNILGQHNSRIESSGKSHSKGVLWFDTGGVDPPPVDLSKHSIANWWWTDDVVQREGDMTRGALRIPPIFRLNFIIQAHLKQSVAVDVVAVNKGLLWKLIIIQL